jgi:hypothetical protein
MKREVIEEEPFVIQLGNDRFTWVDQEDASLVGIGWTAKPAGKAPNIHYYAGKIYHIAGVKVEHMLHNIVWERMMNSTLPRGFLIDHINGDKLDNRRSNLRLATRNENEANKGKRRGHKKKDGTDDNSSQYKGVSKMKDGRKKCWRAIISTNQNNNAGKTVQVNLGTYYDEKDAAKAYNKAAVDMYGEFASLNDLSDDN